MAAVACARRRSRLARARAPKREVELVELRTSTRAEAVRDDILHRAAPAPRNSLEEILAAGAAGAAAGAAARNPAPERRSSKLTTDGVFRGDGMAGLGAGKGGDGECETGPPPYAR